MSVLEALKAISRWKIDAVEDRNPEAVHVPEHRIDNFFEDTPSFVIGKKGTGKTAFAKKLQDRFPRQVYYVTFRDLFPIFAEIQRHQRNARDFDTKVVALQLAACLSALQQWAVKTRRALSQERWKRIVDRVQRPALLPAALASVVGLLIKTQTTATGDSSAEFKLDLSRVQFHLNDAKLLRKYIAEILRSLRKTKGEVFLFIDGIDDHQAFEVFPFKPEDRELLKAFFHAIYFWDHDAERSIRLIAMMRPEFVELANIPNIKAKIEDESLPLRWGQRTLADMLSHRITTALDQAIARGEGKSTYIRRLDARDVFGQTQAEFGQIISHLFDYSFLRPRDVIRYAQFVAHHALELGDATRPVPLDYFLVTLDQQRGYLLDEMEAELAITLPNYKRFVSAIVQLQSVRDDRIFFSREEFEDEIQAVIERNKIDIDVPNAISRLYSAFAIGYRTTGSARKFLYNGGASNFPENLQVTFHDLFREPPRGRVLVLTEATQ